MPPIPIEYRELDVWPGKPTMSRKKAPFKQHATRMWDLLDRELANVRAKDVVLSGYFRPQDFKRDGGVFAHARPTSPGIVLEFTRGADRLRFMADLYLVWLDNVDAIARTLEKLRAVERYGVMSGSQYQGYKAIPASTSATTSTHVDAALVRSWANVEHNAPITVDVVRSARRNAHPDAGGSHAGFIAINDAAKRLGF